jgi:hypothetical protein
MGGHQPTIHNGKIAFIGGGCDQQGIFTYFEGTFQLLVNRTSTGSLFDFTSLSLDNGNVAFGATSFRRDQWGIFFASSDETLVKILDSTIDTLDGPEVEAAMGGGCPNPLDNDSDDDSLLDGDEVAAGTNSCNAETDGDGLLDNVDPTPTDPGATASFLEQSARKTATDIQNLDLSVFNGPNANANKGRRNALANRAIEAANAIAAGNITGAIDALTSLLEKIDGQSPPPDWIDDSPEKAALANEVSLLISLLRLE